MIADPRLDLLSVDVANDALLHELATTAVVVRVGVVAASLVAVRTAASRAVDLASRLFDNVRAVVEGGTVPGWVAEANNRAFAVRRPVITSPSRTVVIGIGATEADVYVGLDGWTVSVSRCGPLPAREGVVAALLAGPVVAAEAFKEVFGTRVPRVHRGDYVLNASDFTEHATSDPPLTYLELDTVLVGCGSVGFGFVDALVHLGIEVRGRLALVDNGRLESKNVYKYASLHMDDVTTTAVKVDLLAQRLRAAHGDLVVDPQPTSVRGAFIGRTALGVLTPDNVAARRDGQELLTREIVNVAIGGTEVDVATLQFGRTACVYCLYHDLREEDYASIAVATGLPLVMVQSSYEENVPLSVADIEIIAASPRYAGVPLVDFVGQPLRSLMQRPLYGATAVAVENHAPVAVTTAFVSALAGTLGLVEVIKASASSLSHHRLNERLRWDLLGTFRRNFVFGAERRPDCAICNSTVRREFFREMWPGVAVPVQI